MKRDVAWLRVAEVKERRGEEDTCYGQCCMLSV